MAHPRAQVPVVGLLLVCSSLAGCSDDSVIEAACGDNPSLLSQAIDRGRDVNAKSRFGMTALHCARSKAVVDLLLAAGANVDARNDEQSTPLHFASYSGAAPVVEVLLKAGASANARNRMQQTPLHWAVAVLIYDAREQGLLDRKRAVPFGKWDEKEACALRLIENGANVNAVDVYGKTPLFLAAETDEPRLVLVLLRHGANVNARDRDSMTALARRPKTALAVREALRAYGGTE